MFNLYFGDLFSVLTVALVLGMFFFIVFAVRRGSAITKWGRLIALFILVGTAISGLSAVRDAYGTPDAIFSMEGLQSTICSIMGGAIFLTGIVSIFLRNQMKKRSCLYIISAFFTIQVVVIELSRLIYAGRGII